MKTERLVGVHVLSVLQEMKIIISALFLTLLSAFGAERQLGHYSLLPGDGELDATPIFEIRDKADREIWCGIDGDFDLGLGKVTDGSRTPMYLTFDVIRNFLAQERHKGLVVLWFEKFTMSSEDSILAERVKLVTKQMQEVGFRRVVILGASSSGVHYVADTELETKNAEQAGTGQPATRPVVQSDDGDKPQPESEGRSQ